MTETLHASCVAIGGRGILILGGSGAGKSDLALRLLDRGAELVSDDGTVVEARGGRLVARAGPRLAGLIEARGVGLLDWPARDEAPLALAIDLEAAVPRLPEEVLPARAFDGLVLPVLALRGLEASAPVKVEQALLRYGLYP